MVQQLRRPPIVTSSKRLPCLLEHHLCATHSRHIARPTVLRRVRVEIGRVAVVPAEIALIDGLCVMADRAVIPPGMALCRKALGLNQVLSDFSHRQPMVCSAHRLIVEPAIHIALDLQIADSIVSPEAGPMVGGEQDIGFASEQVERLLDVSAPTQRVARLRPPKWQGIVHRVRAVLGQAERSQLREHEVHLRWGLCAGCVLEHHANPVNI